MNDYSLTKYLTAINYSKEKLLDTDDKDWEKKYPPFIINKGLSYFSDTVMYANEMNINHHIDHRLQFDFFINIVKKKKRFSKWLKPEEITDLNVVKEYYGYSNEKAKSVLSLFTDEQLTELRKRMCKGGKQ